MCSENGETIPFQRTRSEVGHMEAKIDAVKTNIVKAWLLSMALHWLTI